MTRHLTKITGNLNGRPLNINIDGNNLIITGVNGSGKTHFIKRLYDILHSDIQDRFQNSTPVLTKALSLLQQNATSGMMLRDDIVGQEANCRGRLISRDSQPDPHIENHEQLCENWFNKTAILHFFEANRTSDFTATNSARGVATEKTNFQNQYARFANNLEQHLVNLKNRRSLAITETQDLVHASTIDAWLQRFESSLKLLMEDKSTKLQFDVENLNFSITQDNKPTISFQSLSSGYSSILDIYAELLMRSEYFSVTPQDLTGIVFIDEIDAHLHVSLQRLILPFFQNAFPSIQFIITTHSPFVLTSSQNSIILDLTNLEIIETDISLYSYSAVMSGLLDTKTTSVVLEKAITEIADLSNSSTPDLPRLKHLIHRVGTAQDQLDPQSRAFYLKGVNILLDKDM